jgi:hypothetical protein|tara:strand:+ start:77 stop:412 length:336 start_codon:yes stop_codon:yes gene_type:complete
LRLNKATLTLVLKGNMTDYRGGYKNKAARFVQVGFERIKYETFLKESDLIERQAGIDRGEPHPINPNYAGRDTNLGGADYVYFYPETMDMGRVKVTHVNNDWVFQWEDRRY